MATTGRRGTPGVRQRGTGRQAPWQATVRGPDGRERTKTFRTMVEAQRWRTAELVAMNAGEWVDPRAGKVAFGDFAEDWRRSQVHRPATADLVESHMRNHVLPKFGARPLASIRPSDVQTWVKGLSDDLAPATIKLVFRYTSMVFKAAVVDGLIARNPCVGAKLPPRPRVQVVPLETAEVLAVIEAMPDHLRCAAALGAGTGLRQGEAMGVTVDRVDFLRRQLVIDRQLVTPQRGRPYLGPLKTPASVRTLPLPDFVLGELARHLERFQPGQWGLRTCERVACIATLQEVTAKRRFAFPSSTHGLFG